MFDDYNAINVNCSFWKIEYSTFSNSIVNTNVYISNQYRSPKHHIEKVFERSVIEKSVKSYWKEKF